MTSLLTSSRQVSADTGYYIPLASLINKVYGYNPTAGQSTFSTALWASPVSGTKYTSTISSIGLGVLRDMGKTVVSSGRTFRKVQLVVSSAVQDGVGGSAPGTNPMEDFLTGYIELGFGNGSNFTPVAAYGR
jgi:hypothetical protein